VEDLLPRASLAALGPRGCVWRRCFYWLWRNRGFRISRAAKPDPRVGDKRPTRLSDPGAFVGPNLNFQGTASPIVRMAENNRPISMAERLSANAAYHFSFVRNCLRWAQEPLVYVNPCGPEALALISDQRGATNNPRRSAESQSRSSARAGRDWPVMPTILSGRLS